MIKTTIWRPDTCECEIEYEWDTSSSEDQRMHFLKKMKRCNHHDEQDSVAFEKVKDENKRKNRFISELVESSKEISEEVVQEGKSIKQLRKDFLYKWSFDEERNLLVDLSDFPVSTKNLAKSISRDKFGSKVKIKE